MFKNRLVTLPRFRRLFITTFCIYIKNNCSGFPLSINEGQCTVTYITFGIIVKEYVNRMTLYRRFQNTYTAHWGSRCSSIGYNDNSEGKD